MSRKEYKINEGIDTNTSSRDEICFEVNGHTFAAVRVANKTSNESQNRNGWMLFRSIEGNPTIPITNDIYDDIKTINVLRGNNGKLDTYFFNEQEFILCHNDGNDNIYAVDVQTGELTKVNTKNGTLSNNVFQIKYSSGWVFIDDFDGMNILTPDGFMFKEPIDAIDVYGIQDGYLFNRSGLVAVERNKKLNIFEERSLVPVLKEFAEDIKIFNNPFNRSRPLILVKYKEGMCDIFEVATLESIFKMSIEDIYINNDGYIFFKRKGKMHLFISPDEYIRCNNCIDCSYGDLIYLDDGYIFYFSGTLSDKFDEVYDIESLFPTVMKNGKFNFLERTKGKPVFDKWFDDVEPYEGGRDTTYNGKTHSFTIYENGEKKTITYSPRTNFSIA